VGNIKIKLLPLLLLYGAIVLIFLPDSFQGDEERYIMYANNLTQGHYSPLDKIYLWNGPGYPIILAPFIILKLPWLAARFLNALLLYLAMVYLSKTLYIYLKSKRAIYISYLLGIYPPLLIYIPLMLTEILSIFLICGFIFHFCMMYHNNITSRRHLFIASFYLAYLALTKIFFGYVILTGILVYIALYSWKRKDMMKKTFMIYVIALLFCFPYLLYTYSLTDKLFYWGDSGGSSLYWMASPYNNEYGDWHHYETVISNSQLHNHKEFFNKLETRPGIERNEELKRAAIHNIINNPVKYICNLSANIGRMLFSYPYSYTPQKTRTYFYIVPNMFLVVLSVLCIYPYLKRLKAMPEEINCLITFFLVSFGGSSMLSAYPRQFMILMPILVLWISYILTSIIIVDWRD
jgi:hypothetical protein